MKLFFVRRTWSRSLAKSVLRTSEGAQKVAAQQNWVELFQFMGLMITDEDEVVQAEGHHLELGVAGEDSVVGHQPRLLDGSSATDHAVIPQEHHLQSEHSLQHRYVTLQWRFWKANLFCLYLRVYFKFIITSYNQTRKRFYFVQHIPGFKETIKNEGVCPASRQYNTIFFGRIPDQASPY